MNSTIRIWYRGPTRIIDDTGIRVDEDFADVPSDTRVATGLDGNGVGRRVVTLASVQALGHAAVCWILREGRWVWVRVEPREDSRIRIAVNAERIRWRAALCFDVDARDSTDDEIRISVERHAPKLIRMMIDASIRART